MDGGKTAIMLSNEAVSHLAEDAVRHSAAGPLLERVLTEPTVDSRGEEALSITIVMRSEAIEDFSGDEAMDLLAAIWRRLRADGDDRIPILTYATPQDLDEDRAEASANGDHDEDEP